MPLKKGKEKKPPPQSKHTHTSKQAHIHAAMAARIKRDGNTAHVHTYTHVHAHKHIHCCWRRSWQFWKARARVFLTRNEIQSARSLNNIHISILINKKSAFKCQITIISTLAAIFFMLLPQRWVQKTEMATLFSVCTAASTGCFAWDCVWYSSVVYATRSFALAQQAQAQGQATFCMRNVLQRANLYGEKLSSRRKLTEKSVKYAFKIDVETAFSLFNYYNWPVTQEIAHC